MGRRCRSALRRLLAGALAAVTGGACATSSRPPEPEVIEESRTVVRYESAELMALVSFRHAAANLGDEWLVLAVALTGGSRTTTVTRDNVSVRGPGGVRYPLPSQRAFRESYPQLHASLHSAGVSTALQGAFGGLREPCGRWFFAGPWEGFAYDELDLNQFRECSGPLVFLVPGGVQPGRWVLEIDLAEARVRIPFVLEDGTAVR